MTPDPDAADEPVQAADPPTPRPRTPTATIALGVVVIVSVALIVAGYFVGRSQGEHAERSKIEKQLAAVVGAPGAGSPDLLTHAKAETFIEARYEVTGVVCNQGKDMTILVGAGYVCTASGGTTYRVTITNLTGDFEVRPVS